MIDRPRERETIAILGATGCVGSRLARRLVARGERVRALVRPGSRPPEGTEAVRGDLLDPGSLAPLFEGVRTVHFLAHAMGRQPHGSGDLVTDERTSARATFELAKRAGVERVVYVSGLGTRADAPSAHLRARFAVEEELRASGLDYTIFKAGVLLGPGSLGFEALLRSLRQSVVIPLPPWREHRMQPFALHDLLDALERAPEEAGFSRKTIDVGVREVPTYGDLVKRLAKVSGLTTIFVNVPFELGSAFARTIATFTGVEVRMAEALVETMTSMPVVVEDGGELMRRLEIPIRPLDEAIGLALRQAVAERARDLVPA